MPRSRFAALAALLLPALLLGGCTCDSDSVNRGDINLISLDKEWEMGQELSQEIARQAPLVQDPEVLAYVNEMGRQITGETELADRAWQFHVVANPSINAFAIPGGHIYVHTGLIEAAGNAAELAGVMAHEVAHGTARHATERLTQSYGINALLQLVVGGDSGLLERIAADLVGRTTMAKFSRDDEREADRLGVRYMRDAGYRPEAMAAMFEKMLAARKDRPNAVEQFFSTHPLTEERIQAAEDRAEGLPDDQADLTLRDPAFERVQQRLSQITARR